jgi:hypothetical protein
MVFPYEDMKKYIFDPVTTNILRYIEIGTYKFERKITGLFLCGTIGQDNYLSELARTMFGGSTLNIFNIVDHSYVVSEGLIIYGSEQHNTSVPHFINKERKQKNFVRLPGNDNPLFNDEILNGTKDMDNVDMVIGIGNSSLPVTYINLTLHIDIVDFGEFESSMSYAPVPVDYQYGSSDHTRLIKDVSGRLGYSLMPFVKVCLSKVFYN